MTIKTITDLANAKIIKFESIAEGETDPEYPEYGSAFTESMSFRKVIKKIGKLSKFLEKNGFEYVHTTSPEYGRVGGMWENVEIAAAFTIEIRYGDHIIVREAEGYGPKEA